MISISTWLISTNEVMEKAKGQKNAARKIPQSSGPPVGPLTGGRVQPPLCAPHAG
jgi:hypothetical protein